MIVYVVMHNASCDDLPDTFIGVALTPADAREMAADNASFRAPEYPYTVTERQGWNEYVHIVRVTRGGERYYPAESYTIHTCTPRAPRS